MENFFSKIGPIDILIDDGGHSNLDQIITTVNVVEKIKDGGVIVIEDTHSSYLKKFSNPRNILLLVLVKNWLMI